MKLEDIVCDLLTIVFGVVLFFVFAALLDFSHDNRCQD
jgi:hypothetical protein